MWIKIIEDVVFIILSLLSILVGKHEMALICIGILQLNIIDSKIEHRNSVDTNYMRGVQFGVWLAQHNKRITDKEEK